MTTIGIDYGFGRTNIDTATGIRYGCIAQRTVLDAWADSAEPEYGEPTCPACGATVVSDGDRGYRCAPCEATYDADEVYAEEPLGYTVDDGTYTAVDCLDTDILITQSPYYTYAPFCSPCVPGAGNLDSAGQSPSGVKTYCFGHDWFDGGRAPYRVYRVSDDTEVLWEPA